MAQTGNNQSRFGGQYLIQDLNHMSEIETAQGAQRNGARQTEQAQQHQQDGGDENAGTQQGGERQRKSR
jgi:hypothetical protein